MTTLFPVTHSILSAQALMAEVAPDYDIGAPVECKLLGRWLNDTYLLRTTEDRYILRVYRTRWRSIPDILYELDLLAHLGGKGVPVSVPIARKDGGYTRALPAPEGVRQIVLFTYAKGKPPWHDLDEAGSRLYGSAAAAIHNAIDDFTSPHARFHLDLGHLLDQPLQAIQPLIEHRAEEWEYLVSLADRLRERIAAIPAETLEWGVCHGDFHGGNAHIDEDQTMTFFDFDCCGPGWRAYEVAVFRWGAKLAEKDDKPWEGFLKGYTERRPLKDVDLAAVPLFVVARHYWFLGLVASNGQDFGYGWLDAYFDQAIRFLREWESAHLESKT